MPQFTRTGTVGQFGACGALLETGRCLIDRTGSGRYVQPFHGGIPNLEPVSTASTQTVGSRARGGEAATVPLRT
jgi:hypothetical protein